MTAAAFDPGKFWIPTDAPLDPRDYTEFQRFAAADKSAAYSAEWAIKHRADDAYHSDCASRNYLQHPRPRFRDHRDFVRVEVERATASTAAWVATVRDGERMIEDFDAEIRLKWGTGTTTPTAAPTATPAPKPAAPQHPTPTARPAASDADQLEAAGCHFAARAERQRIQDAEDRVLHREVEQQVASRDRLYRSLRNAHGVMYAREYLENQY